MTLLEEAKKIRPVTKLMKMKVGTEDVELILAYLDGKISLVQLKKAKGIAAYGGAYYAYVVRGLLYGLDREIIKISKVGKK